MSDLIQRQTFKGSLYSFVGAFLGFVNTALLMPKVFSPAEISLPNTLIAVAIIFAQIGTLGFSNVINKIFPQFRDKENKHNGFPFLILLVSVVGSLICTLLFLFLKTNIADIYSEKSPLFSEYSYLLIPYIFISLSYSLLSNYNRILFNASFAIFTKEFLVRVVNLVIILLYFFDIINFEYFIIFYTIAYSIPSILICALLIYNGNFSLKPSFEIFRKNDKLLKQILSVAFWGLIAGFAGTTISEINKPIISAVVGESATGIYSIMFFFGTMILIPGRSLTSISGAVISQAFKDNDMHKVETVYKQSVINLTLIGVLFFIGIWVNIDNIMHILGPQYESGRYVIFFTGLGYLMQMMAGTSGELINFGNYYRQFTVIMLVLVVSLVGFTLLFLYYTDLNITGAGLAYFIAFFIYFWIRLVFIKIKYKFQPFNLKFFLILIIGVISFFVAYIIPTIPNFIVDTIIRSSIILIIYCLPIYYLKISPDLNSYLKNVVTKTFKRKQKK